MAASVRMDDEAFSDERYEVLATVCQLADSDHARGKMARLWRQCTAMGVYVLPASVINAVLGQNGARGLVESHLGELVDDGIRVRGTRGRIEWLKKLKKNAKKGGKAKAAKRQALGTSGGTQKAANTLPPPCPPTPTPTPIPFKSTDPDITAPPAAGGLPGLLEKIHEHTGDVGLARALGKPKREPSGPHQQAISEFDAYYQRAHNGAKPTWNATQGKRMKQLLDRHGVHEITRRIAVLEQSPPKFPPPPWDFSTFALHFDKIAAAATASQDKRTGRIEPAAQTEFTTGEVTL